MKFSKLGKTAAAAILEAHSVLQMRIDDCNSTNQSVQASWLPFHTELQSLACFNHCVTFSFLYTWLKTAQNLAYVVSRTLSRKPVYL